MCCQACSLFVSRYNMQYCTELVNLPALTHAVFQPCVARKPASAQSLLLAVTSSVYSAIKMCASPRVTKPKIYVSACTMAGRKLSAKSVMYYGVNTDQTTRGISFLRSCDRASWRILVIKPSRRNNFSILFWNETLHVSDISYAHHQEFFTVYTANLYDIYHCCVYSEKLLMMDRGIARNM